MRTIIYLFYGIRLFYILVHNIAKFYKNKQNILLWISFKDTYKYTHIVAIGINVQKIQIRLMDTALMIQEL